MTLISFAIASGIGLLLAVASLSRYLVLRQCARWADDARDLIDQGRATVLDIRDEQSFAAGRINGARHIDNAAVPAFVADHPPADPVIVCCYHGHSSQPAAAWLASSSPSRLRMMLSAIGALCWLAALVVHRRTPRRVLQVCGTTAWVGAAVLWGLR